MTAAVRVAVFVLACGLAFKCTRDERRAVRAERETRCTSWCSLRDSAASHVAIVGWNEDPVCVCADGSSAPL